MQNSETRLQDAVDAFERLFTTRETGLRLALVTALFAIGLNFLFSPELFESFPSFAVIVPIPEWLFGCLVLGLSMWLMFSSRGLSRRWAVGMCGVWWLFWGILNHSGAKIFTPGTAVYLVLWLLSSIELYRENARVKEAAP